MAAEHAFHLARGSAELTRTRRGWELDPALTLPARAGAQPAAGTATTSACRPSASSRSAGRSVTPGRTKWNAARTRSGGQPASAAQASR